MSQRSMKHQYKDLFMLKINERKEKKFDENHHHQIDDFLGHFSVFCLDQIFSPCV